MVKFSLILSLQHAIRISHKNCACSVNGAVSMNCSEKRQKDELCNAQHVLNFPLFEPNGGTEVKQTHVACIGGKIYTNSEDKLPPTKNEYLVPMERLCLKKDQVEQRKQRLHELLANSINKDKFPNMKNVHVIARATASQRDAMTGLHQETVEWDELVIAVNMYFKEIESSFHNIKIMPIQNEGNFALMAIKTLLENCSGTLCAKINLKKNAKLLVSMEQGGRSMQIWFNEDKANSKIDIPNKKATQEVFQRWGITSPKIQEVYSDQTGLYSNLGNGEIINQLAANSSCLIPTTEKTGHFNKATCRGELEAIDIIRSKSNKLGQMPELVKDGLYVAFGCFYYPAKKLGIADQIKPIRDVKTAVVSALNDEKVCPDGHKAVDSDLKAMKCLQLLVLELILKKMVPQTDKTPAEILFVNQINGKDISWTVGLAETIKDQVKTDEDGNIVVLDIGSSSTKIFTTSKKKDAEAWSDMEKLLTLSGGDLKKVTASEDPFSDE